MKQIAAIIVLIMTGLTFQSGCTRQYFEGTLFTYSNNEEPTLHIPLSYIGTIENLLNPPFLFESEEFWSTHAKANPGLSTDDINALQKGLSLISVETFRHQGDLVAKWIVRIKGGDREIFQSLCSTYVVVHEQMRSPRNSAPSDAKKFLADRRTALEQEYLTAKALYDATPNLENSQLLEIAHNNFTQLEERLKTIRLSFHSHGQIVYELMNFEETNELGIN